MQASHLTPASAGGCAGRYEYRKTKVINVPIGRRRRSARLCDRAISLWHRPKAAQKLNVSPEAFIMDYAFERSMAILASISGVSTNMT